MKRIIIIISSVLLVLSPITLHAKVLGNKFLTQNSNLEINSQIDIKIDSIVLGFFEKSLTTEGELIGANYQLERLKQPINDFWKLTKIPALKRFQSYRFVKRSDKAEFISFDVFEMRSREVASQLIDLYCNIDPEFGEVNAKLKGSKSLSGSSVPFKTFCVDSYVFVVDCSTKAIEVTGNTFETFVGINNELPIDALDYISAQRDYIEDDVLEALDPVVMDWLNFYNLKIEDFVGHRFHSGDDKVGLADMTMEQGAPFFMAYNKKEWDVYDLRLNDYSPNQKYYINFLSSAGAYLDKDNKYYYFGSDENQTIYLINNEKEKIALLKWLESAKYADAAFWVDNETCVIVGRSDSNPKTYFIECFGKIEGYYEYRSTEKAPAETYLIENLKLRGVKVEK